MKNFLLLIIMAQIVGALSAQVPNEVFSNRIELDTTAVFKFHLKGLSYFRDNEYFTRMIRGYTLFGNQIHPQLSWQIHPNWLVYGGLFLHKGFGAEQQFNLTPTYAVKYQKNHLLFIFGNLEGNLQHGLIEPIFNFENLIKRPLEEGMQLIYQYPTLLTQVWVNWQQQESYENPVLPEKIEGGLTVDWELYNDSVWSVHLLQQNFFFHQGTQNYYAPFVRYTTSHPSVGFKLIKKYAANKFIYSIATENHLVGFTTQSDSLVFKTGHGWYFNLAANTKAGKFLISYWEGNTFSNPQGGDLFSGVSRWRNYTIPNRKMAIIRWMKDCDLGNGLVFTTRVEPYYDFHQQRVDYSFSFYLNYQLIKNLSN